MKLHDLYRFYSENNMITHFFTHGIWKEIPKLNVINQYVNRGGMYAKTLKPFLVMCFGVTNVYHSIL